MKVIGGGGREHALVWNIGRARRGNSYPILNHPFEEMRDCNFIVAIPS